MPISAPGRTRAEQGFTLVELLIVLTIIGLMSAAVVLAIPDPRGSLVSEAERFAARAHAAQERAITDARPVAIRVTAAGYGFDRRENGEWKPLNEEPFTDRAWGEGTSAGVPAESAQRVIFDTTGTAEPVKLLLLRDEDQVLVEIGADGKARVTR
jgi:general secretion pathway protein H